MAVCSTDCTSSFILPSIVEHQLALLDHPFPTMSDSRDAARQILDTVLSKLHHLNLVDNVYEIGPVKNRHGGSSDVHRGKLRKGGTVVEVAIKRIRASLQNDHTFAKVRSPSRNCQYLMPRTALRKGNGNMVKARAREHHCP